MLCLELFQAFLSDGCHCSLAELGKQLGREKQQQKLLTQLQRFYTSERRHLLRCVKHLFGYWQDSSHPFRVGVREGVILSCGQVWSHKTVCYSCKPADCLAVAATEQILCVVV